MKIPPTGSGYFSEVYSGLMTDTVIPTPRKSLSLFPMLILWALLPATAALASTNSQVPSYPESRVIEQKSVDPEDETFVITSQVSEVGDRLRYSDALTLDATGERLLLEIPATHTPEAVLDYYQAQLADREARILFSCEGRGCGRSNIWANRIFDQSRLYGRDGEQGYLVGVWRDDQNSLRLLNVYVVRRGNRTISVLEQQLKMPEDYRLPGGSPRARQVLGPFIVPYETGTVPNLDLDPETANDIQSVAERYEEAAVYLVGFAPASLGGPDAAMEQSERAIEAAGRLLVANGIAAGRQRAIAVGAAVPIADSQRQGPRVEVTIVREGLDDE